MIGIKVQDVKVGKRVYYYPFADKIENSKPMSENRRRNKLCNKKNCCPTLTKEQLEAAMPKTCLPDLPVVRNFRENYTRMEEERARKKAEYADVVGRKFRPTFESNIDYFEIRGYDMNRDMVLTTAHPKDGEPFDDEIEERYLVGAFETGDYEPVKENQYHVYEQTMKIIAQPYLDILGLVNPRHQEFNGPCCARCCHRFGTTSNRDWCKSHQHSEKCYRFKLEKN